MVLLLSERSKIEEAPILKVTARDENIPKVSPIWPSAKAMHSLDPDIIAGLNSNSTVTMNEVVTMSGPKVPHLDTFYDDIREYFESKQNNRSSSGSFGRLMEPSFDMKTNGRLPVPSYDGKTFFNRLTGDLLMRIDMIMSNVMIVLIKRMDKFRSRVL
jgi:hypothetical protein